MARPALRSIASVARMMRHLGVFEIELFEDGEPRYLQLGDEPEAPATDTASDGDDCDGDDESVLGVHELFGVPEGSRGGDA